MNWPTTQSRTLTAATFGAHGSRNPIATPIFRSIAGRLRGREPGQELDLNLGRSAIAIGVTFGLFMAGLVSALGQSLDSSERDPMIKNGPPVWDVNRDGVFTCDEWKKHADRIFTSADRNHDGKLDPSEFPAIRKEDPTLADADFGYFDENQDGKITRKEFVDKPSAFILRFDRNGDCRVTADEMKATLDRERPREPPDPFNANRFH